MENKRSLKVPSLPDKSGDASIAGMFATPYFSAALLQLDFNQNQGLDLMACMEEMLEQCDSSRAGNLKRLEDMLLCQAHALQTIFTRCASKLATAEYLNQAKVHGALALKAQNQCRQTLATLADIKNPKRATFIKNSATNQQINLNAGNSSEEKSSAFSNGLLSEAKHEKLDSGTACETGAADFAMAAVEKGGS